MILADRYIARLQSETGFIRGFDASRLEPAGYRLRTGSFSLPGSGEAADSCVLEPLESVYVCSAEELSMPECLVARAALRDPWVRSGLVLAAPVFQPGHQGSVCFRLTSFAREAVTLTREDSFVWLLFEELSSRSEVSLSGICADGMQYSQLADCINGFPRTAEPEKQKAILTAGGEKRQWTDVELLRSCRGQDAS